MKVLILNLDLNGFGGVQTYYTKIKNKFNVPVKYFVIGRRVMDGARDMRFSSNLRRLLQDYRNFMVTLENEHYDVILLNPSLAIVEFIREGVFHFLARRRGKKVVVFFRGWRVSFEEKITKYGIWFFRLLYGRTAAFIVLSRDFEKALRSWGVTQPIHREVTIADDDVLGDFDIEKMVDSRLDSQKWKILFLAKLLPSKGIYETIEAFALLREKHENVELIVAGTDGDTERVKALVAERKIPDVVFTGYIRGEEKDRIHRNCNVLLFPTTHLEGLPNTVIETLAYGIPIITRPVGGIADIFTHQENGFATTSTDPAVFADLLEKLISDRELYRKISLKNYEYARSRFLASSAARRLEKIWQSTLEN